MRLLGLFLAACCLASCGDNPSADNTMNVDDITVTHIVDDQPEVFCEAVRERVTADECADLTALKEDVRTGAAALDVPSPMTRGRASEVTLVVDRRPLPEIAKAEQPVGPAGDGTTNPIEFNAMGPDDDNAPDTNAMNAVEPTPAEAPDGTTSGPGDDPAALTPNQVVAELPGENHPFYSRVGKTMKATLVGNGFEIKLIEPRDPVQEIPPGGQGTWIWEVIPREGGPHTLTALTEAVGKVGDRSIPLGNGRTSKTVTVEVRTVDRLWDMIVAAPAWLKALAAVVTAAAALLGAWLTMRAQWRNRDK